MGKVSKIQELREAKENAKEALRLSMLKGCEYAITERELRARYNASRDSAERAKLKGEIEMVQLQHAEHNEVEKALHKAAYETAVAYSIDNRRLSEAERVLKVIKDPPPWGYGADITNAQLAAFEKQARKVVKELG